MVKEQDAVFRTGKRPGDPQEQAAGYPVQALGQSAAQSGQEAVMHIARLMKGEGQAEVLHGDLLRGTARLAQAPVEGFQHFPVVEADRGFQAQVRRLGEDPRQKGREPPVPLGNPHTGAVFQAQLQAAGQHLRLPDGLEMGRAVFRLGQEPVGVVDADFRAGIDAVLALPEFNQPRSAPVVEIHREGVEDHLEPGGQVVIGPGVAPGLLPGVHSGGEEAAAAMIPVAEGFRKLLQKGAFFTFLHLPDSADDFLSAEMAEQHAHKGKQQ